MDLPELKPIFDVAVDTVVSAVNRAKEQLGKRQTLKDFALCRELFAGKTKLSVTGLRAPLAVTAEAFIRDAIALHWKLTDMFMFTLTYKGGSCNETAHYYYYEVLINKAERDEAEGEVRSSYETVHYYLYEAIFSQPTKEYPIPQATASVYFRAQDKYTEPAMKAPVPMVEFKVEGSRQLHDIRYVTLVPEWLLAIIKMKIMLSKRVENYHVF